MRVARRFRVADDAGMVNGHLPHMGRLVHLDMVNRRKQNSAFQVLEHGPEFDAS